MAEKGEKGYSIPSKKSSLKDGSLNGKDDSSIKSKKGRKVQFDQQGFSGGKIDFSSKSGGKGDTPIFKGGKGDKVANGEKSPVVKPPQPLEFKVEQELPENVKCQVLMDCEAANILLTIQDQMVILSADPTIKIPVSFDRGLQYAKRANLYTDPQSVRNVLETLKQHDVKDSEICMIANVFPETVDEVFALLPSLKSKRSKLRDPLKDVISELGKLKKL